MANYNAVPPKQHQFKPGNKEGGKKKLPAELAKIALLTKTEVGALFAKYVRMPADELQEILQDENKRGKLPMIDLWLCSGIAKGVKEGDWVRLNLMFDRLFGRPKNEEIKTDPNDVPTFIVELNEKGKFLNTPPRKMDEEELETEAE